MKKILSTMIAAMLMFSCLSLPVMAVNETRGTTELNYAVPTNYVIIIPSTITLSVSDGKITGGGYYGVAANSIIAEGKCLTITVTNGAHDDENTFRVQNSVDANVFHAYTIKTGENDVVKGTPFFTATDDKVFTGATCLLTFTTETIQSAGTYSDTLTFTVNPDAAP